MTVTLATWGRFHFFDLARELARLGTLERLHTTYPAWAAGRFGVPEKKVTGMPMVEIAARAARNVGPHLNLLPVLTRFWDREVARRLQRTDVFVGLSGFCVHSVLRARELGAVTILERASSHIRTQARLLQEERDLTGAPVEQVSSSDFEREEAGYTAADYVLVPSSFVMESFLANGFPREKLLLNYLGVDLSHFRPRSDARPKTAGALFRVINAGAFTHRKGMHYLAEAARMLDARVFEFLNVGFHGGRLPFAVPHNFRVLRRVGQPALLEHYWQSDVFVLPTIEDGFPVVIPQAMACGLPVITTPNGSGPDLIRDGENGFIVPIRDARAIADRLEWMRVHPEETYAMGQRARQTVVKGLSWEEYGRRTLALYRGLLP